MDNARPSGRRAVRFSCPASQRHAQGALPRWWRRELVEETGWRGHRAWPTPWFILPVRPLTRRRGSYYSDAAARLRAPPLSSAPSSTAAASTADLTSSRACLSAVTYSVASNGTSASVSGA